MSSVQAERRVLVRQEQPICLDPQVPPNEAEHEVTQTLRPPTGEEDREEGDEDGNRDPDAEKEEHHELRDHENEPEARGQPVAVLEHGRHVDSEPRVVTRVARGRVERERRILLAKELGVDTDADVVPHVQGLEVRHRRRQFAGEDDREPRHQAQHLRNYLQHPEHDEMRDGQQPVHQWPPVRYPLWWIERECCRIWLARGLHVDLP